MMRMTLILPLAVLLTLAMGCSDDSNPTGSSDPDNTETTVWVDEGGFWRSMIDATDGNRFAMFSFTTKKVIDGAAHETTDDWDIAFRRHVIKLNGGTSTTNGGDAAGVDLGPVDFDAVSMDDTAGAEWVADAIDYFINEWYSYNHVTHQLDMTGKVYSMVDAGGHNYLKFRVDSLVGASQFSMGTAYLTYYYQPTVDSRNLDGSTSTAAIDIGSGAGYFDFSSGSQVNPADPANSLEWDIAFSDFELKQNSGPNGIGECAAFYAWGEIADPTDIEAFTSQPANAPMFPDAPSSALTEWYSYDGQTHQLTSLSHVYLIRSRGHVYKIRIDSYYANAGGTPVSGMYTFVWAPL